jgi:hypothetical protein
MTLDPKALKALVEDSGISFKQNGKSYILTCPKCAKREKLYIRKSDGRFVCWHCAAEGFQGRAEYALVEVLSLPLKAIQTKLYGHEAAPGTQHIKLNIKDFFSDEDEIDEDAARPLQTEFPPDFVPIDHAHAAKGRAYLEARGIPVDIASQYNLQYWPMRRRVVYPVCHEGKVFGWEARTIEAHEWVDEATGETRRVPKSLGMPDMKKDLLLMFWDRLRGSEHAMVCEGGTDAIKSHLCGGNVATMGKNISPAKLAIIRASGVRKIYSALDPDASKETANLVKSFGDMEVYHVSPMAGKKDLGEMTFQDVHEQFLSARRVTATHLFGYIKTPKLYSLRA